MLPGFEFRGQQLELAEAIEAFLASSEGLLAAEAPTGIGKTFALLAPALKWAQENQETILILTSGITLQEQLVEKDIPVLQKALGLQLPYGLLKGRSNYVCLRKAQELGQEGYLSFGDGGDASRLIGQWIYQTDSGDLSELELPEAHPARERIASSFRTCLGSYCPYREQCFFQRSLRNCYHWRLVVANYHVYFAYRVGLGKAFPVSFGLVVCDEAHRMVEAARSVAAVESNAADWQRLLRRPPKLESLNPLWLRALGYDQQQLDGQGQRLRALAEGLYGIMALKLPEGKGYLHYPKELAAPTAELIDGCGQVVQTLRGLQELAESEGIDEDRLRDCGEVFRWGAELEQLGQALRWCSDAADYPQWAYWREGNALKSAPILGDGLIAQAFETALPEEGHEDQDLRRVKMVALSATLTLEGSFQFWSDETGLVPDQGIVLDSPFDLKRQMEIQVVDLGLAVAHGDYDQRVAKVCRYYCRKNGGATLVLLSSKRLLTRVSEYLCRHGPNDGLEVLVQGDLPRRELLNRFRNGQGQVLIGLASFREGIDVPGQALTQVIIDRIPFPHPGDPLVEARSALEGGANFRDVILPEAKMGLRQAMGRLIRSSTDTGKVVLLDGRILSRRDWGFLRLFPQGVPVKKIRVVNYPVAQ